MYRPSRIPLFSTPYVFLFFTWGFDVMTTPPSYALDLHLSFIGLRSLLFFIAAPSYARGSDFTMFISDRSWKKRKDRGRSKYECHQPLLSAEGEADRC
jgi:hypothetical protein